MRVGVVVCGEAATAGGAHTFEVSLIKQLCLAETPHELYFLYRDTSRVDKFDHHGIPMIDLNDRVVQPGQGSYVSVQLTKVRRRLSRGRSSLNSRIRKIFKTDRPRFQSDISRAATELKLDVVWFLGPDAEVLSIPYFATVWDLEHRKQPYFPEVSRTGWTWEARESNYRKLLPRAARIFCGTETGRGEIEKYYSVNRNNIVVNPFMSSIESSPTPESYIDEVLKKYQIEPGYLFYPAQFWPHKNHVNLLHALAKLRESMVPSPVLVLTGSDKGNLAHVEKVIRQLDLQEQVRILGFVPRAVLIALYRRAVALVFPSLFGPDNMPPLEAFALNCPVLASDIDGSREQLGNAALYFKPTDVDDMAQVIAGALREEPVRAELIKRGKVHVSSLTAEAYVRRALHTLDTFANIQRNWDRSYINS